MFSITPAMGIWRVIALLGERYRAQSNEETAMKIRSIHFLNCATVLMLLGMAANVQAGAVHYDYPFEWVIPDYIDCTDENGTWTLAVSEVSLDHETPSGKGHSMWHAWWDGTLVGDDSEYEWHTRGILQAVSTYSVDGDPVGVSMQTENSVIKPLTPGAPWMIADIFMKMTYNANGDLVVEKFNYALDCLGKKK